MNPLALRASSVLVVCGVLALVLGCATFYQPVETQKVVPRPPAQVYEHGLRVLREMGEVTFASQAEGMILGRVKNVVVLQVRIRPHAQGSQVEVHGKVLPDKVVLGKLSEVQTYVERLEETP